MIIRSMHFHTLNSLRDQWWATIEQEIVSLGKAKLMIVPDVQRFGIIGIISMAVFRKRNG